ncbi:MAG: hypothetical protein ACK5LN_01280, partial [Propioniciclava sp.]
ALDKHGAADVLEFGTYVERVATNPLATYGPKGRPILTTADWPVMVKNPTKGYPAGALNAAPTVGAGGHWWYQLTTQDFNGSQLPSPVAGLTRPTGW